MTKDNFLKRVQALPADAEIAAIIWTDVDVRTYAREQGVKLTKKQAKEITGNIHRSADCSIGINWDVIASHIL